MRRFLPLLAFAVFFATPACAQEKIKIEVTGIELTVIGQALGKMPYETAAPVLKTLQDQINAADKATAEAKAATAAKPVETSATPSGAKK